MGNLPVPPLDDGRTGRNLKVRKVTARSGQSGHRAFTFVGAAE